MSWTQLLGMLVWTGAGGILLFVLMWIDTLFTKYKDMAEIKNGNVAVTTRFVMKLFAQGYILSQSIMNSNELWNALLASVVSFIILLLLQKIAEILLKSFAGLDLERGTQQGKVAHAMVAGSFHLVGALILGALV
ncbi:MULTISPECIES: DUF350 domain-containing protein [Brevibacillus]|uniref:DUF350 domain-containing protein n=1 Tax=Brevibacillus parabrevis TaxID=54914 RepID=A0A4Y3PEY8_BREPA|nr:MULTISPECIES: DUF350 domain-containing protein [Brevibacillus]NRQ54740.1 DUF350 domain-containing protein [Brevibacillus sp. HD1.4A]KZE46519.1 cell surface protein [Brevibacillus parabrevis]MBU8711626.1 DUF350 domain-containing protein [Brevibacillus parabrevis]MDH6349745.1 uncharacterized membrane protein YjfL (UPF0719 family) [Brevibacillus sp. 1238]MDR4999200.1 DUF350 domain-containing protein [Brevibacillus parabrevis]